MKKWILATMIALAGCNDAAPAYITDCNDDWNEAYDIAVVDMQSLIADRDAQIKELLEEREIQLNEIQRLTDLKNALYVKVQRCEQ